MHSCGSSSSWGYDPKIGLRLSATLWGPLVGETVTFSMFESDPDDPRDRLADHLVEADAKLLSDLVAFREMRKLSQEDVAKRMGIHKSNVSRLESGVRDVQLSTLRRYAMAMDAVVRHDVIAFEVVDVKRRRYRGDMTTVGPEQVRTASVRSAVYV